MTVINDFAQVVPESKLTTAEYKAATETLKGVSPGIARSLWHNKAYYQWSLFIAAFSQSLANKGYVMSDSDFDDLVDIFSKVLTEADGIFLPLDGTKAMTGHFDEAQGTDLVSASTVNLGAATGNYVNISGTNTITSFGIATAGVRRIVTFLGALTLTHNSTSISLPGGKNVTTAAGDSAIVVSLGGGIWKCVSYQKADGKPVNNPIATDAILGIIKAGKGVSINEEGALSSTDWGHSDGSPGFVILPGGMILQGGYAALGAGEQKTLNFPKEYTDGAVGFGISPTTAVASRNTVYGCPVSKTQFVLGNADTGYGPVGIYWTSFGK